jgi:multidrug transporter EmrE-like cation transporter
VQTPAVVFIEMYFYNKRISGQAMTSIGALLVGVVLASIYDPQVGCAEEAATAACAAAAADKQQQFAEAVSSRSRTAQLIVVLLLMPCCVPPSPLQVTSNPVGVAVATINIVTAALNSVWTGSMQREAGVDGNQLLLNMSPWAAVLLAPVVPLFEPLGLTKWSPHSVFGYIINEMDLNAAMWILASAVLGLVVSQSACMFIGCTSGTTYSVVSHLKTLSIVVMGVTMFGDSLSLKKGAGLALAMSGLVWYSFEAMRSVPPPTPQTDKEKAAAGEQVALLVRPVRISSDTEAAAAADYDQAPDQEVADVDKVKPGV